MGCSMPCGPLTFCVLDVKDSSDLGQRHQGYVFELGGRPCLTQRTPERGYHLVSLPGDLNMKTQKEKAHTHIKLLMQFLHNVGSKMFSPVLWWSSGETFRCFSGAEICNAYWSDTYACRGLPKMNNWSFGVFPSPCSHYQARASIGQRGPQPRAGTC